MSTAPIAVSVLSTIPVTVAITAAVPFTSLVSAVALSTGLAPSANLSINPDIDLQRTFRVPSTLPSSPEHNPTIGNISFDYNAFFASPPPPTPELLKPLAPSRPEMVFSRYIAEKEAWLATHPTVRLTEYRKKRGWQTLRPALLKQHSFHMPPERRDPSGKIIQNKANWTNEEIIAWLDNEDALEEEEVQRQQAQIDKTGHLEQPQHLKQVWESIVRQAEQEAEHYTL